MKEEALKLADELAELHQYVPSEAPAMIRRLVEELDRQQYKNKQEGFSGIIGKIGDCQIHDLVHRTKPQTKPLSDEEIKQLSELTSDPDPTDFVRAIEERHGIK